MIYTRELRLGNYIRYHKHDEPAEVLKIYEHHLEINNKTLQFFTLEDTEVQPIQITVEFLIKFNFIRVAPNWWAIKIKGLELSVNITENKVAIDTPNFQIVFDMPFNGVHGLQNWIYANTGEELTMNNHEN